MNWVGVAGKVEVGKGVGGGKTRKKIPHPTTNINAEANTPIRHPPAKYLNLIAPNTIHPFGWISRLYTQLPIDYSPICS